MSIKKQPEFESENDVATAEAPAQAKPDAKPTPAAAPATTSANVPTKQRKFSPAFADIQDAFPVEAVAGLSIATPRIKGEQGAAYVGDKRLGAAFRFEIESWNHRWLISSGSDDAEAKDYLRTSYDNATIYQEGKSCAEYLDELKDLGFERARIAHYIDIWGFVVWTDGDGEIAPEDRTLHIIQASQTSAGAFDAFRITQGLLRAKGIGTGSNIIEVHAMARSKGSMKYTNFEFLPVKA